MAAGGTGGEGSLEEIVASPPTGDIKVAQSAVLRSTSAFHPSLGLPEQRLVYRPCRLFPTSPPLQSTQVSLSVTIPPASIPLLFAHRQWRAGLLLADLLSLGSEQRLSRRRRQQQHYQHTDEQQSGTSRSPWDCSDCHVIELGCGTGIPGLITARLGEAAAVLLTDYDSSSLISALRANCKANMQGSLPSSLAFSPVAVQGFTWGTHIDDVEDCLDSVLRQRQRQQQQQQQRGPPPSPASMPTSAKRRFDRILLADCLWDSLSHAELLHSLDILLATTKCRSGGEEGATSDFSPPSAAAAAAPPPPTPPPLPCILLVSGFHTGRSVLIAFLRRAFRVGLELFDIDQGQEEDRWLPGLSAKEEEVVVEERVRGNLNPDEALYHAPCWVYEMELANQQEEQTVPVAAAAAAEIDSGYAPRLTGRRRAFVLEERPEENKDRGGVYVRNRWITIWGLRRKQGKGGKAGWGVA